ncbi:MAG: ABC transporter permease subunit [Pseudomonadota bacterium]
MRAVADAFLSRLGRIGVFLWSGWAGLAGFALIAALWQAGHERYGDFILPAPLATLGAMADLLREPATWEMAAATAARALQGFVIGGLVGAGAGLIAGYSFSAMRIARPILTVMLGVPPIAWIVLAMIWFGSTDGTVVVTVVIAIFPLVFVGAAEGVMTRDKKLDEMARAFGASAHERLTTLALRQMSAHLFPALGLALGTAFKVAVMAELLANIDGVGGALATARANLDIAEALAWVMIAVAALIAAEYGLVHPVRSEFERWRDAERPWGVKR